MLWFQRATEGKVGMGGVPERLLGTGVKVKPKLQWRTQDVDESRTMKHFWWKDVEWSCLKREAIELVGVGLPRPFGTPDTQHEYRISCCPDGVWSCFYPIIPCCAPIFPFWGVPQMDMPHPTGIPCYYVIIDLTWFSLIAGHKPDESDETHWKC